MPPVIFVSDIDDSLRTHQILDLLADGEYFDRRWPFISMPESYISPWSRLVDLPHLLTLRLFEPLIGLERALILSGWLWPLLYLTLFLSLCARLYVRITQGIAPIFCAVLFAVAGAFLLLEFAPGRVDHHNIQILLSAALLWQAVRAIDAKAGAGLALGVMSALSLAISLEALPFIVAIFSGFAGMIVMRSPVSVDQKTPDKALAQAGLGLALVALPLLIASGWSPDQNALRCDSYSPAYAMGLSVGGLALWAGLHIPSRAPLTRIIILGVVGILAGLAFLSYRLSAHAGLTVLSTHLSAMNGSFRLHRKNLFSLISPRKRTACSWFRLD